MESKISSVCVAGIDVRKDKLNTHILPADKSYSVVRTTGGFKAFFHQMAEIQPAVAVMEAGAGDKIAIASVLAKSGCPVVAIHTRQLNQYAERLKIKKMTSLADAYVMAHFALELHTGNMQNIDGYSTEDLIQLARTFKSDSRPPADPICEKVISDKYRFLWVGIPKVATRSILTALYREPLVDLAAREVNEELWKLLKQNEAYQAYFKFAFVRNPWARIVSSYLNKIERFREDTRRAIIDRYPPLRFKMPFEEFIRFLLEDPSGRDEGANRHWMSQHIFVADKNGELLVDFIGKMENLKEDFATACQRIKLPEIRLPWLNSREGWKVNEQVLNRKDPFYYRTYFTDETRELVRKRYRKDIEMFGYDF